MPEPRILATGLGIGESPRWHEGRLWFSNWGLQEVVALDPEGREEVVVRVPTTLPFCIDWPPDGRLLVVSGPEGRLLRREPDGAFVTHADLRSLSDGAWYEIVVDGRGRIYVDGVTGIVALVAADGSARQVVDGIALPHGMAVTADNRTLIVAEALGRKLTVFDIGEDGSLSGRRVWADLRDGFPDGICLDAEGAAWYADIPNKRCVRVREGGEVVQTVPLNRGGFACILGGADRKTLFVMAAEWRGMAAIPDVIADRTGPVLAFEVDVPGAGWP
jgi:sugar lactone lactonase YvrE